jgi:hypothetical protein
MVGLPQQSLGQQQESGHHHRRPREPRDRPRRDDRLSALPGVQRMTSTLVMKRVVPDRPLPA